MIGWSQDGSKTVPRGLRESLGPSWGSLGPLLEALGPSLEGLGKLLGRLVGVLGCSWGLLGSFGHILAAHEAINGSFWIVLERDALIRFIDSIRSLDRSMVLHHVVNNYRLNKSARRNARSDPPPPAQQASACCKSTAETFLTTLFRKVKHFATCCSKMQGAIRFAHSAGSPGSPPAECAVLGAINSHQNRIKIRSKISCRFGLVFGSSWPPS